MCIRGVQSVRVHMYVSCVCICFQMKVGGGGAAWGAGGGSHLSPREKAISTAHQLEAVMQQ